MKRIDRTDSPLLLQLAAVLIVVFGWATVVPAAAASVLLLGPRAVQTVVAGQLFNRNGRWYLIDDGACHTYLESPHTHLEGDRLVLRAHLASRLGQSVGSECIGADLASNVTVSAKLRGSEHQLLLDDIRIDRVDDESTRNALNLALQLSPQSLPKTAGIDIAELVPKQAAATGGLTVRIDQFRIVSISTRGDAVVIQFDLGLSAP